MKRAEAERMDAEDAIGWLRDHFVFDDPGLIYLDGNSLGRLPKATIAAVNEAMRAGWGSRLVRAWHEWIDVGQRVGDHLGKKLLGAAPGQVAVSDSTSVNLYKLATAALDTRPGRRVILSTSDNFPTDRYILEGLAAARGLELRLLNPGADGGIGVDALKAALGLDVALVSLSHVSYLSGAIEDVPAITRAARYAGALVLWDLSHSAGAVPIELDSWGVDLAVGCTYKYLNGGPGAPAFGYIATDLQDQIQQPIWGWMGAADPFAMAERYRPAAGVRRFISGTPPVLAMQPVKDMLDLIDEVGVPAVRAKSIALTEHAIALFDDRLSSLGAVLASSRDPAERGSHVTVDHPRFAEVTAALWQQGVIPDFRPPDGIRIGLSPLSTSFAELEYGIDAIAQQLREPIG